MKYIYDYYFLVVPDTGDIERTVELTQTSDVESQIKLVLTKFWCSQDSVRGQFVIAQKFIPHLTQRAVWDEFLF